MSNLTSTIKDIRFKLKTKGLKAVFQEYRWKLVIAVFIYYLIRDSFLYILIPYLSMKYLF